MRPVIIVFAKAPIPGNVKTRLMPDLSAESAASLHRAFVADLLDSIQRLAAIDLELHTDAPTDAWASCRVARRLQIPGDLSLKLLHALEVASAEGHPRTLIIGSDSPTLPLCHLSALLDSQADVCLGPAEDGGYWGISCCSPHPNMFDSVRWSTPYALKDTVSACQARGLTVETGPVWFDVDDTAGLDRLIRQGGLGAHTEKWVRSYTGT